MIELLKEKIEEQVNLLVDEIEQGNVEHQIDEVVVPKITYQEDSDNYLLVIKVDNQSSGLKLDKKEWDEASNNAIDHLAKTIVFESNIQAQAQRQQNE